MGWLWSSSPVQDAASTTLPTNPRPARDFGLTDEQRTRIFGQPPTDAAAESPSNRGQQGEAELQAFLDSLQPGPARNAPGTGQDASTQEAETEQASIQPKHHERYYPDGSLNISPQAVYPRTMSCRQAFDQAFYCQSLGGKFNDIYRYGHVKSCSDQWGAFWFCMRTRTLPAREKEERIADHYATAEEKRRKEAGGSSEDVWQIREKAVERAFWRDPDEVERSAVAGEQI